MEEGFARARSYSPNTKYDALLKEYQADARKAGKGLWGACSSPGSSAQAPVRKTKPKESARLPNPGDTRNCADFRTYAEAKSWFDLYFEQYGDVAKLDADGDGIPCEALLRKRTGS